MGEVLKSESIDESKPGNEPNDDSMYPVSCPKKSATEIRHSDFLPTSFRKPVNSFRTYFDAEYHRCYEQGQRKPKGFVSLVRHDKQP